MTAKDVIEFIANIAAIATPLVGIYFWTVYKCEFSRKREALEKYLKEKWDGKGSGGSYQFTFLHLTAKLGLTESEILQASFDSCCIKRLEKCDEKTGLTTNILFQFDGKNSG
jgi:hypothetical protein